MGWGISSASRSSISGKISNSIHAGLGILTYQPGIASRSATSGSKPYFAETYPMLALKGYYNFYEGWAVSPDLNLTLIGRKSAEGKEKLSVSSFGIRFCRPIFYDHFDLHLGPGLLAYQIKGEGGTQVQSNGSGSSTFGIPNETRTSILGYLDLGMGYQINEYRIELSALITQPFSSTKRAYSPLLTLTMGVL